MSKSVQSQIDGIRNQSNTLVKRVEKIQEEIEQIKASDLSEVDEGDIVQRGDGTKFLVVRIRYCKRFSPFYYSKFCLVYPAGSIDLKDTWKSLKELHKWLEEKGFKRIGKRLNNLLKWEK